MKRTISILLGFLVAASARAGLPERLSETGLYADIATKRVAEGIVEFSPQYPLWTDGAKKTRWIYLPPGSRIDSSRPERWVFPVGTKLWKEFRFDDGPRWRRVETRLIVKLEDGSWDYAAYVWNEDESDAVAAPVRGIPNHFPLTAELKHDIPGKRDCKRCHEQEGGEPVLGFSAIQLSDDRDPTFQAENTAPGTTLRSLFARNLLSHVPDESPRIHASPKGRAAMGYLMGNCAHCHNPQGSANYTELYFHYDSQARDEKSAPAFATAVGKASGFEIPGQSESLRIKPRGLAQSSIYYRMVSRANHMPPIGTKINDCKGISLVRQWISSM